MMDVYCCFVSGLKGLERWWEGRKREGEGGEERIERESCRYIGADYGSGRLPCS